MLDVRKKGDTANWLCHPFYAHQACIIQVQN